jgi:hypothetical protein
VEYNNEESTANRPKMFITPPCLDDEPKEDLPQKELLDEETW